MRRFNLCDRRYVEEKLKQTQTTLKYAVLPNGAGKRNGRLEDDATLAPSTNALQKGTF